MQSSLNVFPANHFVLSVLHRFWINHYDSQEWFKCIFVDFRQQRGHWPYPKVIEVTNMLGCSESDLVKTEKTKERLNQWIWKYDDRFQTHNALISFIEEPQILKVLISGMLLDSIVCHNTQQIVVSNSVLLTSITIEFKSNLCWLRDWTFMRTCLTWITIPASIKMICKSCFYCCELFTSVTIESIQHYTELKNVYLEGIDWLDL